jgi:hypothetical protein
MLQFGASLTDDARSINYDRNTFIIQATGGLNTSYYSVSFKFGAKPKKYCSRVTDCLVRIQGWTRLENLLKNSSLLGSFVSDV